MTKGKVQKIVQRGYFDANKGDWFEIAVWTIFVVMFCSLLSSIVLFKVFNSGFAKYLSWLLGAPMALTIVYYTYLTDRKLRIVNTGLTEAENLKLLRRVTYVLDWPTREQPHLIEITDGNFFFKHWVKAKIVYTDNVIGYVFQYRPTWRGGRPTFLFGIRSFLRHRFKKMLVAFVGSPQLEIHLSRDASK